MRLTFFIVLIGLLRVSANVYSQQTKLSMDLDNVTLKEAFREIEDRSNYVFFYNAEQIQLDQRVNLNVENKNIDEILNVLFRDKPIAYQVIDRRIVLYPKTADEFSYNSQGAHPVKGKVTNEKGEPIPGVTVVVKGTMSGSITDSDGNYSLTNLPGNSILVFSFVGLQTREVEFKGQPVINVVLEEETIGLEEVVAIGYGTMKKSDLTGSINRMVSEDFNQGPITNPLQQLQGKMTGVNITQAGSDPNTPPSIRIRGINSLAGGNDPLVVVDGVQGGPELLQSISPNDIESYDILKDASSTAIYGSRGAAGVVIVSTKKSKTGKIQIEFNSIGALETNSNQIDVMNSDQWRSYIQTNNISASDYGANTDWFDEITRHGYTLSNDLALTGGTDKINYRASLSFINQSGIILESGNDKLNGALKIEQKNFDNKLRTSFYLNVNSSDADFIQTDDYDDINTALIEAYRRRPCEPVKNEDGSYFYDPSIWSYVNPVALLKESDNHGELDTYLGSIKIEYDILKNLTVGLFGSKKKTNNTYGYYEPSTLFGTKGQTYHGYGQKSQLTVNEKLIDISANYKQIIQKHRIEITGIYEWQESVNQGFKAIGRNFISNINGYNNLGNGNIGDVQSGDISSFKYKSTLISFLARFNYAFHDKYLLTINVRHDGSSKLGSNDKWGTFPSASIAWRISQEPFMKDSKTFTDMKLRVGYGHTGNQGGLTPYQSLRLLASEGSTLFNGESTTLYGTSQNENKNLKWEVKKMLNVGLDFLLFDGKLNGTFDLYNGKTEDMLYQYTVPVPPFYTNTLWANIGEMTNKGIEFSMNFIPVNIKDKMWSVGFNISKNKNKIKSLSGYLNEDYLSTDIVSYGYVDGRAVSFLKVGQPVGVFYVYKHQGVDADGNEILADLNNDGKVTIDNRSPDRYIAGNPQPKFIYGINSSFRYKKFDGSITFSGVYGNKIYNGTWSRLNRLGEIGIYNVVPEAVDNGIKVMSDFSDLWIQSGSFLRLSNLTLGYNMSLPSKHISKLRFSFTGNNLFVITNYKGVDPEVKSDGSSGFGIDDYDLYPRSRSFAIGLSLTIN